MSRARGILIIDSRHLCRICRCRSSQTSCRIFISLLLNILAVSTDLFQTVYDAIFVFKVAFKSLFMFSGFPEAQVTQIMEHVEKLIMTRLHKWVFCHDSCDDEQKDLALQRRIRYISCVLFWFYPSWKKNPELLILS